MRFFVHGLPVDGGYEKIEEDLVVRVRCSELGHIPPQCVWSQMILVTLLAEMLSLDPNHLELVACRADPTTVALRCPASWADSPTEEL